MIERQDNCYIQARPNPQHKTGPHSQKLYSLDTPGDWVLCSDSEK